ncbi:MAG TPA: hypothetical protein ENH00_13970 [Actinobacteria bacterium]|nr:hypothetical protein [Actinomycetota bacterium]
MGHVPTGEVPAACARADLSRREYRRTGARRSPLTARRLGELGERVAADYLIRRGFSIIDRNVRIGRGEIDLVVERHGTRIAVEVKSTWLGERNVDGKDPLDAFDEAKEMQVWSLARHLDVHRVDLVAITFGVEGVQIRWVPGVA